MTQKIDLRKFLRMECGSRETRIIWKRDEETERKESEDPNTTNWSSRDEYRKTWRKHDVSVVHEG